MSVLVGINRFASFAMLALALAGCRDQQSALAARGPEAEQVVLLSWILFWGGTAILILVIVLTAIALFGAARWRRRLNNEVAIIIGGLIFPMVTLTALLVYGLIVTSAGGSVRAQGSPLRVTVIGEQWWWRVVYPDALNQSFESANEIRIPIGRSVELTLATADVIHSFWVPNLAGKLDMIPGRTNVLRIAANKPGVSRGQCAEFCGGAHAMMSFHVVALSEEDYVKWRVRQAAPALPPQDDQAKQGLRLFMSSGCGGCHTIRGTDASGRIGPDLTHVGGRFSLAAGTLPNDASSFARWIRDNQHIKPENRMPPYGIFTKEELTVLSSYLAGLK